MYFYILQLFDRDYREDIVLALTSAEIKRATIVEGLNLDKTLEQTFPMFTGLFRAPDEKERYSLLFFGVVESREALEGFQEVLQQAGIDNRREEIYRLVVVPAERLG